MKSATNRRQLMRDVIKLRRKGMSYEQIGDIMGYSHAYISIIFKGAEGADIARVAEAHNQFRLQRYGDFKCPWCLLYCDRPNNGRLMCPQCKRRFSPDNFPVMRFKSIVDRWLREAGYARCIYCKVKPLCEFAPSWTTRIGGCICTECNTLRCSRFRLTRATGSTATKCQNPAE